MKKNIYFLAITAIFCFSLNLAKAQMPTFNFEEWETSLVEKPKGWATSSIVPLVLPVTKTTDKNSGQFAMKLESKVYQGDTIQGFAMTGKLSLSNPEPVLGFPYTQRPSKVSFHYKYTPAPGGDSMFFMVQFYKYDSAQDMKTLVGMGQFVGSGTVANYTKQEVEVMYFDTFNTPDSAYIMIQNTNMESPMIGSVLFIDDIEFVTGTTTAIASPATANFGSVSVFPNPTANITNFNFELKESQKVTIKVMDVTGREVATIVDEKRGAGKHIIPFDASSLKNGIYIFNITGGSSVQTGRLVVNK